MGWRVNPKQTQRARALRNGATRYERKLWRLLSTYRPAFTRQLVIGPYIVDFACRQAKLVVEVDGGQYADSSTDKRRDAYLQSEGWTIIRLWNNEVAQNPNGCVQLIMGRAAECLGGTHPQPLPSREGRPRRSRFGD